MTVSDFLRAREAEFARAIVNRSRPGVVDLRERSERPRSHTSLILDAYDELEPSHPAAVLLHEVLLDKASAHREHPDYRPEWT